MLSVALIAMTFDNLKLERKLSDSKDEIHVLQIDKFQLQTENDVLVNANNIALQRAKRESKTIEKKVVEIQKVYVPQIEYIDRYIVKENNETRGTSESNCKGTNELISSIVY